MIAWRHEPGPCRLGERNVPELSLLMSVSHSARSKPTEAEIIKQRIKIIFLAIFLLAIGLSSAYHHWLFPFGDGSTPSWRRLLVLTIISFDSLFKWHQSCIFIKWINRLSSPVSVVCISMTDLQKRCVTAKRWCRCGSRSLEEALSLDQTAGQQESADESAVLYNAPDEHIK